MHIRRITAAVTLACAISAVPTHADEIQSPLADQKSVAVTIYNNDLALVKDRREIQLGAGIRNLALRDVSGRMRPETAQLRAIDDSGWFRVLEQNFDFDLLTPRKLLEKFVGRKISVVRTHPQTGADSTESAEVLAANEGVVLRIGNRIETGVPGRLVFDSVPANLRDRPTLVTQLDVQHDNKELVELSYLTGGLSWQADYVAELSPDNQHLALNGWVTLTNHSGTTYANALLQLVAGDVNRVRHDMMDEAKSGMLMARKAMPAAEAPAMQQQSLFEYHLYTLGRPTTLADNQTKQVALLSAAEVSARRELLLQGNDYYYRSSYGEIGQKMKVGAFVEFTNKESDGLGIPVPKGVVRVYQRDHQGRAQFVGEDRVDHTPKNEKIRLKLGDAFDVTADKKQTDFKSLGRSLRHYYRYESAYEIVVRNAKSEDVTVVVREPIPGDWTMLESTLPHTKVAAGTAEWSVPVPASGKTVLRYRVLVQY